MKTIARRALFCLCVLPLVFGFVLLGVLWPVLWVFTGKGFEQLSTALADFTGDFYDWAVQAPGAWRALDQEDK
jgi:hypothetical protein